MVDPHATCPDENRLVMSLQGLLAASASDLEAVDGIGTIWARQVREGLSHLAESTITDPLG